MPVTTRCSSCGYPVSSGTVSCPYCASSVSAISQTVGEVTMSGEGFLLILVTVFLAGTIFGPALMNKAQRVASGI